MMATTVHFSIEGASDEAWSWIAQGQGEIAWHRLGRERQRETSRELIQERSAQQTEAIRRDGGFPTQTFVARSEDGSLAGYVWVAKSHHDFTGELEASILGQYVAEPFRGQGLGQRLMHAAEEWARAQRLRRISLSIGAHNTLAQNLYGSIGYKVDSLRMAKELVPEVADEGN